MKALVLAVNILIVGNSLTYFNEMPWMLEQVALSKKTQPPLHVSFTGRSGLTLKDHVKRKQALDRIAEAKWDYVFLQAQSTEAVREPRQFEEYARILVEAIRKRGAKPVIVQTWATLDAPYTQRQFNERYDAVAAKLHVPVAPVGSAWQQLQSRGVRLLDDGGVHPNVAGSYLYASVLYAFLYGRPASGATHTFDVHFDIPESYRQSLEHDRIDDATAEAIHRAAWGAVAARFGYRATR